MPKAKTKSNTSTTITLTPPIKGSTPAGTGAEAYAAPREGHVHSGVDIPVPEGTDCIAPMDGKITSVDTTEGFSGGGMIHFEFTQKAGNIPKGAVIGWGHVKQVLVQPGPVKQGTVIAKSGGENGPCVHFIYLPEGDNGGSQWDGVEPQLEQPSTGVDPTPVYSYLMTGKGQVEKEPNQQGEPEVGGAGVSGISSAEAQSISKGAAVSAFINLPGLLETAESLALKGERSLMNDQPLLGFVEQLCQGSLRQFMSLPNGDFFAFIPDYFGGLTGRTPYWEIDDIEILNGEIQLSDDALATHVFVVGDTGVIDQEISLFEKITTTGVITIFNAFMADFLNGVNSPALTEEGKSKDYSPKAYIEAEEQVPSLANKAKAISFLERYGARPYYEEAPMIRSHYFETFLAYQLFCLLWSKQFITTFEFTFMPELIPGGLVAFPQHGLQCYIDEVQHTGDYESGFRTRANLSAPSALPNGNKNLNAGMIRADIFNPQTISEERYIGRTTRGDKGQTGSKHAVKE